MSHRITDIFSSNTSKLVTFVTGGDPNLETSKKIIKTLAKNGADIIEIGMPFSDPMADGPTIQLANSRAIKKGIDLKKIFSICNNFRKFNSHTPIILMGYYNIILYYGLEKFIKSCKINGVDGIIVVDLQPEEDPNLLNLLHKTDIKLIRLITPTTDHNRLKVILKNASGFLYYVSVTGITGQNSANIKELEKSIKKIKKQTQLPIVSGFGIKNSKQVTDVCKICEGAVVGSSIINVIENNLHDTNKAIISVGKFIKKLKNGIKK